MWDLIVSVPEHCLSFYFVFLNGGQTVKGRQQQEIQKGVKAVIRDPRILCISLSKFLDLPLASKHD